MSLRATPFHARVAAANRGNDWLTRNGVTLARAYDDAHEEALAARFRCVLVDISWRWRVMLEGPHVMEFLGRLLTRDVSQLAPGQALKALWLADGGGMRGAGAIARYGKESFLLVSTAPDFDWIARAASRFDVGMREISEGGLALIGPHAGAILQAAGIDFTLEPLSLRKTFWRGLDVTLSRFGEQGGYEIWRDADDGLVVWDRLMRTGAPFGLQPAGITATDILDLEAGIARPIRDYAPARDGNAKTPTPKSLGLEILIDASHETFNGRAACLAAQETKTLVGLEIDCETPAPFTPLLHNGQIAGHTLTSLYSPALRRAIALAQIEISASQPGTQLVLTLSPCAETPAFRNITARVTDLPFVSAPISQP
ncbi:MAG TPA: glycine cleavage T C-terminal barrel domain-containing protein [Rhizomicrobium sp.]|nr:glycine cleavage T C-terminal barrel domain-containing protein [Rhizomicrobium sp.]